MSIVPIDGQIGGNYPGFELQTDFVDFGCSNDWLDMATTRLYGPSSKELSSGMQRLPSELDVCSALNNGPACAQSCSTNNTFTYKPKAFEPAMGSTSRVGSTSGIQCGRCNRWFTTRRSLLRHGKTVHGAKTFSCAESNTKFGRKDTRDRHVTEKHSHVKMSTKCMHCGRYVTKRAFREHLDSDICQKARTSQVAEGQSALIEAPVKYTGPEDDPFLAALRMLRLFAEKRTAPPNSTPRHRYYAYGRDPHMFRIYHNGGRVQVRGIWLLHRSKRPESSLLRFENLVVSLLAQKIAESKTPSLSLSMAAWLLGCMASAVDLKSLKSRVHFIGAAKLFKLQHVCAFGFAPKYLCPHQHLCCPHRCAELELICRLLEEHEIPSGVIGIDAPEAAFEHPDRLLREGTFKCFQRVQKPVRKRKRSTAG